jgi:polyisoprenoid-binding protein YceI
MIVANVKGEFAGPVGTVTYDPKDLTTLRVEATIDARTINTRNPDRDKDLRSDLFFDVTKYPKITFKSRSVTVEGPGKLKVLGDLTIKGITKPVTLDVEGPTQEIKDIWGSRRIGATGTTTINRLQPYARRGRRRCWRSGFDLARYRADTESIGAAGSWLLASG